MEGIRQSDVYEARTGSLGPFIVVVECQPEQRESYLGELGSHQ
jgi:hypothetical protein